ncbi:DUF2516 family protein [Corynebacterium caspium]|uniref:DUF2516 family protein n=1 Tax=Corynebacterium caspium TaxID=234828 RepID=UPI00037E61D2|nr:DUF2516 family protein [Corynebacterium caspium]WKD59929.1 hypothetical protein CCASP_07770 [Corynebacterium caspium DSM 44850]
MPLLATLLLYLTYVYDLLFLIVGIAGAVGAARVATTRADAFTAADRMSKHMWLGALLLSAMICLPSGLGLAHLSFIAIVGVVVIGVYWFDVYPQIRDILSGRYQW